MFTHITLFPILSVMCHVACENKKREKAGEVAAEGPAAVCGPGTAGFGSGCFWATAEPRSCPTRSTYRTVWGVGFGVWGLGVGMWGLGFGDWGLGFGV